MIAFSTKLLNYAICVILVVMATFTGIRFVQNFFEFPLSSNFYLFFCCAILIVAITYSGLDVRKFTVERQKLGKIL